MRAYFFLFLLIFSLPVQAAATPESLPLRQLRQLVAEEQRILDGTRRGDGSYDENRLQWRFQELVDKYEVFIGSFPESVAGYVAYGRLLDRIGEVDLANALYMKANRLDPNIPLVKNQLGNYLVEEEKYEDALPYYLSAIELAPEEGLYHYQLGNLLATFRAHFIERELFDAEVLDSQMQEAFRNAARRDPGNEAFAYRYAESFYDLSEPRWDEALGAWKDLEKKATSRVAREAIRLHQAHILIKKENHAEAGKILGDITQPALLNNRDRLLEMLPKTEG